MQAHAISAALFLLALCRPGLEAATFYVATNGNDANPGTLAQPFATPQKAVATNSALAAGDTIYIRGGTYLMNVQVKPNKTGAAGNPIKLWAYPGETPVFDFSGMAAGSTKALDLRRDYWHVKGLEVKNAPDSGIFVGGLGQVVEACVVHDCQNDGIIFGSTSVKATNCLVLNCDSFRNYGGGDGNNGDGFAAKAGNGPGNVFRGCRAWNNADDGWDFYDNNIPVTLEGCWSFANGFDLWGYGAGWSGNGNGFKLGGEGTAAEHRLTNCVTFGNRSKGFDHNNGDAGQTMVHCTSYNNGAANFSFFETPTKGTLLQNILINCVSFAGGSLHNLAANTIQTSNSWQLVTVSTADFASLDTSVATNARSADGSLPVTSLFRLSSGSQLIDRGLNVGRPFTGAAPDLGAFEFSPGAPPHGPLNLSAPVLSNGNFQFTTSGLTAHGAVVVHASSNLIHWQPIHTSPPVNGSWQFTVTNPASPNQFYRTEEK
jgi:hypothetical protein